MTQAEVNRAPAGVIDLTDDNENPNPQVRPFLIGLDRRQMEAERLERLKRKRSDHDEMDPRSDGRWTTSLAVLTARSSTTSSTTLSRPVSPPAPRRVNNEHPERVNSPRTSLADLPPSAPHIIEFPRGTVKRTWAFNHPRLGDDIKIEEVLQRNTLQFALLSAFCLDLDWILPKLDLRRTKVCLVMHAQSEDQKTPFREWAAGSGGRLRVCFPWIAPSFSCMHSKLQLLFHETHLRVVIPTANLVSFDWGEPVEVEDGRKGAIMENMVFLIDLPRYPEGFKKPIKDATFFAQELDRFLKRQNVPADIRDGLLRFDFSETVPYAFAHTMAGRHDWDTWRNTGTPGLGRAVQKLGLATNQQLEIDYVGSSLGLLNRRFVESIYRAAQGDDGMRVNAPGPGMPWTQLERRFRIYFPANEVVERSFGGRQGAGSLFMSSKAYTASQFPRELMRDCVSRREGMLMHNKLMLVRTVQPHSTGKDQKAKDEMERQEAGPRAWAYLGSANFSRNAWGTLMTTKDKTYITPSNWECGVIIPVDKEKVKQTSVQPEQVLPLSIFDGIVPLPMVCPGAKYGDRKPWMSS